MKNLNLSILSLFVIFGSFNLTAAEKPPKVEKYTIYVEGKRKAGEQVVQRFSDGLVKVSFIFKDNGRGPEITEEIKLDKQGFPVSYSVKGTSTLGNSINEHYQFSNGKSTWSSPVEKGERFSKTPLFYAPLNGSLEVSSLLLELLAKNKTLDMAPSGQVTQKKWGQLTVKSKNHSQKIQLVSITGLGLTPNFYWVTTGAKPKLFAFIEIGYMWLIEEEWANNLSKMEEEQKKANAELYTGMAKRLQIPLDALTVVTNAKIFNSETATVSDPTDVYVYRGRITALKPAGSPIVGATQKIDANGRLLSPGLFDMHGHLWRSEAALHVAGGVTTVRDMGNNNLELQTVIDEISHNQLLAPQVVPLGFLEGQSPFSANLGFVIKELSEAKKAIDWYAEHGYPQLKIYNSFPRDILKETVAYAHSRGMTVSGHVPAFMKAQEVVEQGYDEIQHINQVVLNFLVKPDTDTRTLNRFYLPAEQMADFDFNSSESKNFIKLLKDHKTVIDPTASVFDFIKQRDGEIAAPFTSIYEHMPTMVKRGFLQGGMKIPDEATAQKYLKSYNKMVEFIGILFKNGIPIVAGTDGLAGFTLHSELEIYVRAGMTPAQAMQVATWNGAKYTRTLNDRGTITTGKLADLVLFDGDPTKNISDVRKVAFVITRGKLIYPNDIYKDLGIKPFVENPPKIEKLIQKTISQRKAPVHHAH